MTLSTATLWLIAGVLLMAAEALGIPGVGLIFAGLGAVLVGAAVHLGLIGEEATIAQFLTFFIATALFARLLWKPLQKFQAGRSQGGYSNIVGETAYVGSGGLSQTGGGEVTWSGTIMRAEMAPGVTVMRLEAGAQVTIVEVKGAKLIVRPK